jgi:hypothetical protein
MTKFIQANLKELCKYIREKNPGVPWLSKQEVRLWVLNDETLYNWARSEGVKV